MEKALSLLKRANATWLSLSSTAWVVDMVLAFVCGLGLFLLLLPCLQGEPSVQPPSKRNTRKYGTQMRGRSRNRRKNAALAACGDCLEYLKETWNLIALVQSLLGMHPDKDSTHQPLSQDPPDEACQRTADGTPLPCGEQVESGAGAPLTKCLLPLAYSLSSGPTASSISACSPSSLTASQTPEPLLPLGHQPPQPLALSLPPPHPPATGACPVPPTASSAPPLPDPALKLPQRGSMALPLGTITQNLSPPTHLLVSSIPDISTVGHSSSAISALPWWQLAAKALCFTTSSDGKFRRELLPPQSLKDSTSEDPTSRQMEAGSSSLLSSDDQKILGIKVTRKVEIKIWKEKEKDGPFLEQMSPGYHLRSLRNMLSSLGAEQDLTTPQPFWNVKDKAAQLLGPQKLSYSKILRDHLKQKYNQLFWGLPSLHSESLVAAAWISHGASALQPPSFLFNGISSVCPVQVQDKMSPLLSQTYLDPQSPSLILSIPQFRPETLGQFQTQAHLQSSLQTLLPSSPPHITDSAASCPASQNKPQSLLPTEIQYTELASLRKQLGCGWALPSVVQRPQEVYNVFGPRPCQENCKDSILPESLQVRPELRGQLEQHIQKWLIENKWNVPQCIPGSLELMHLREELQARCQAKEEPCSSQCSVPMGEGSRDSQKVRFQLGKDSGKKNLGHILGKVQKDPPRILDIFPQKVPETNSLESERNLIRLLNDSEDDFSQYIDKNHLGNTLKDHLYVKSEQINEGLIPWSVRQSWLSFHDAFSMSESGLETTRLPPSECWETYVSTCRKLPFLKPCTQQALEEHIVRFWVKHKWGLPLKVLKPINLFKLKMAAHTCLPDFSEFASPSSVIQVSGASSKVEKARILGKTPHVCQKGKVLTEESVPTLASLLLISSLAGKEIQRALTGIPADDSGLPTVPPSPQESSQPSPTITHNLMDRTLKSRTVVGTGKGSFKVDLPPRTSATCYAGESSNQSDVFNELKQRMEVNPVPQPPVCATDVCLPDSPANTLLASDALPSPVSQCYLQCKPVTKTLASPAMVNLLAARRSSLGHQISRIPKHQDTPKTRSKMYAPVYKGEVRRRNSPGKLKEMEDLGTSRFTQVRAIGNPCDSRSLLFVLEKKQVPSESYFHRSWRRFIQWIFPGNKKIKDQGEALKKCKSHSVPAQGPRSAKGRGSMDSNTAEAQELMAAVGQILEKKMALHHKCCAAKLNKHKEACQGPACQCPCCYRAPICAQQRRIPSCAAAPKGQSCSIKERQERNQQFLKNVRFNNDQWGPRHPHPLVPKKVVSSVSPTQHGPTVPRPVGRHHSCPRHCLHPGGVVSAQSASFSPVFPGRKT